jgi:hypothetical protein
MFDEGQHHPKWSFVRGWNERRCTCHACTPSIQLTPYQQFIPVNAQPTPYTAPQTVWGYSTIPTITTNGIINVK